MECEENDMAELWTPVAFLIFNRPEVTRRVFEEIRRARPSRLLVVADGPRATHPGDAAKCEAARDIIAGVDWPCEVLTNFSEVNLGCRRRVSSGLDWVFNEVEEAIILEDDCLPDPTFFRFCNELLEKYREDERIFHISGNHFRFIGERNPYSYYFSYCPFAWGWASWRRAWRHYDVDMKLWPSVRDGQVIGSLLGNDTQVKVLTPIFEATYRGDNNWDNQWALACGIHRGLSIRPHVNLVSNIGFGAEATHTRESGGRYANLPTEPIAFPLQPPPSMTRDSYEDQFVSFI